MRAYGTGYGIHHKTVIVIEKLLDQFNPELTKPASAGVLPGLMV